jgi:hypothetical protein
MNTKIMIEYLRWFDSQMRGRKVILLMDNFSAYVAAAELIEASDSPLRNTKVRFFPLNVTSKHQPLDQGIIAAWKAHWKRQWLKYMVEEAEVNRDPITIMDVLKAIKWGVCAWHLDVSEQTIRRCWVKSALQGVEYGPQPAPKGTVVRKNEALDEDEEAMR